MSSLVDASTPFPGKPTDDGGTFQIVHFDATLRRKEKMRQKSSAPQAGASPAALPSAVTPSRGAEPMAPVSSNGRGQQAAPSPQISSPQISPPPIQQPPVAQSPAAPPVAQHPATATETIVPSDNGAAGDNGQSGSATPLSGKALEEFLVNFVVEQTGYPQEMVELDADLEADLGIDSIKKAQLFGELAEHFDVQAGDDLSLDDFPTLRHVMNFLTGVPQKGVGQESVSSVTPPSTPVVPVAPVAPVAPVSVQPAVVVNPAVSTPVVVVPAPVAPSPVASSPASADAGLSGADLEKFLVDFVVEQTGYPQEMIELDADLEADLGIDSIKKAQLFGELAEHFDVQAGDDLSLDDFPTLRHVMNFLAGVPQNSVPQKGAASVAPTTPTQPAPPVVASAAPAVAPVTPSPTPVASPPAPQAVSEQANGDDLESFLVNFVVEQTGYPSEMVELDADLEADLGIDSIKKAQLFGELAEYFEVQMNEDLSLDDFPTLRHVMNFLEGVPRKATV